MEEKLLEIMDKNEKSLNKNKEELQKVIEEEINKHKMELNEGKFEKTTEQSECEKDLTKIEKELDNIVKDREILKDKQKKEKEISEEKKIVKKLTINKKECEEAIKEEQGKYSFSEGKFTKTPVLLEYEKDLEKINRELNSKLLGIVKQEKELKTLKSDVDKMMSKYNVKAQIKEEKETKTENKEQKETKIEEKQEKETKTEYKQEKDTQNQTKSTEEIIKEIQKETEEQNRNYGNIHLEAGPYVDKVSINKQKQQPKNTFEIENAINDVYKQMQNDSRNITEARKIEQMSSEKPATTRSLNSQEKEEKEEKVKYIEILEKEGNINYYIDGDEQEHTIPIQQAFEEKKEKFKRLGISEMCKEIAGGRIKGALLKRKINPEIVAVLGNDTEQLKEYISSISEKKNLPFDLVHNLLNTNLLSKIKLNRFVKAEEKAGAYIYGKLFDKNSAIIAKEKTKALAETAKETAKDKTAKIKEFSQEKYQTVKSKGRDFVQKIPNKDSKIEEKARAAMAQKESERELANSVKEIMQEQESKER
ncbi:MAG: hypothetical protein ACLTKT_07760 [Clostridia bacterium]